MHVVLRMILFYFEKYFLFIAENEFSVLSSSECTFVNSKKSDHQYFERN
jgi:hypothetical protein